MNNKDIEFRAVTPIELTKHFPGAVGALEYHIKHAFVYGGVVMAAFDKDKPAGAVFLSHDSSKRDWEIDHVFIEKGYRGSGLCVMALEAARKNLPPYARRIFARVLSEHSYGAAMEAALKSCGYTPCSNSTVYRCHITDDRLSLLHTQVREKWKGLFVRLENAGYEYKPFSEISKDKYKKYLPTLVNQFPLLLDPLSLLTDPVDRVDMKHSILALRDGRPAAIGIVTSTDGRSLVFRQLAVSFRDSGKGLSVTMCSAFAESLRGCDDLELLFTIHNENEKMIRIRDMLLLPMLDSCKKQVNYKLEMGNPASGILRTAQNREGANA